MNPTLDRVPWASQWRRVREVEGTNVVNCHFVENGDCGNVDPLGDFCMAMAKELDAEESSGVSITRVTHTDSVAVGIVSLVIPYAFGFSRWWPPKKRCVAAISRSRWARASQRLHTTHESWRPPVWS